MHKGTVKMVSNCRSIASEGELAPNMWPESLHHQIGWDLKQYIRYEAEHDFDHILSGDAVDDHSQYR
jgi:hypothetical protein